MVKLGTLTPANHRFAASLFLRRKFTESVVSSWCYVLKALDRNVTKRIPRSVTYAKEFE